jgi:hypothetical protein
MGNKMSGLPGRASEAALQTIEPPQSSYERTASSPEVQRAPIWFDATPEFRFRGLR